MSNKVNLIEISSNYHIWAITDKRPFKELLGKLGIVGNDFVHIVQ